MGIKSSKRDNPTIVREKPFPKLMINAEGDRIMMFEAEGRGFVVYDKYNPSSLHWSTSWYMPNFKDFDGTILLENE